MIELQRLYLQLVNRTICFKDNDALERIAKKTQLFKVANLAISQVEHGVHEFFIL